MAKTNNGYIDGAEQKAILTTLGRPIRGPRSSPRAGGSQRPKVEENLEIVGNSPMFNDLSVGYTVDVHGINNNRLIRRSNSAPLPMVGSVSDNPRGNKIALRDLTEYCNMKIGIGSSHATDVLLGSLDIMRRNELDNPFEVAGIYDLFEISFNKQLIGVIQTRTSN
jgi:hypothetical protein